MKGDAKVIEYLNKGLRHELTAVKPVLAALPASGELGIPRPCQEMAQGIDRGNAARRQVHRSHHLPRWLSQHAGARSAAHRQNVKEILDCDMQAEISARALYQEAATYCHSVKDYPRASCSRS